MWRSILLVALCAIGMRLPEDPGAVNGAPTGFPSGSDPEMQRAAIRAALCSENNAKGTGLLGAYFAHALDQGQPWLRSSDGAIDFEASFDWPSQMQGKHPSAARWHGWVKPVVSGLYKFHADQQEVNITVARQPMSGPGAETDAMIELVAGRFYPITLEVKNINRIVGRLRLEWTTPYGARFVIPGVSLFMPVGAGPNETARQ
jgi:hypothetical protein